MTKFNFQGRSYTPPSDASQLEMRFSRGTDIEYPVPPSLIVTSRPGWKNGKSAELISDVLWKESQPINKQASILFHQAQIADAELHESSWDSIPAKDCKSGTGWGTPTSEDDATESLWTNTVPTDPPPSSAPWDDSAQPKQNNTAALWGQPPAKDRAYSGPWFRVDTIGEKWQINDHRIPPLWAEPSNALAFSFEGGVYLPDKVPELWFRFVSGIAPHPIQPKDSSRSVRWQQVYKRDLSSAFPWGEGRYQRIKDHYHRVSYGGEIEPEPTEPNPEPPALDNKECYLLMNTVNAVRLPDDEPLELLDISIELDIDSFSWQLSATVANRAVLAMIEPDANGTKDVKVTINGWEWVFMVTRYNAERTFNRERYRIAGESRTRLLSAPYAPLRSKTEINAISAVQAAEAELTNTGFTLNWDSDEAWATPDWILPGGLFSYVEQTPMQVIARIATTAGAVVIPAPDVDALLVQPRYKISSWNWLEDTTPIDHAIPESMVLSMSVEWRPEPAYNAVYVSGINEGVAVEVQRSGSAGDQPAPDIIEEWLTTTDVNTERGRNVLGEGGNQALITLELPLTVKGQEPGLVLPGQLVEVLEDSKPWVGLCLSTSVSTSGSGAGRVVQSLSIERHY